MIKSIFNPGKYPNIINFVLVLLRLAVGILMLTHGLGKLSALFADAPIQFLDPIGLGATMSLPLLYASIYFVIIIVGAGKISIDNWIYKK